MVLCCVYSSVYIFNYIGLGLNDPTAGIMDRYSKMALTVIAISTSVLAAQSLQEKVLQLHQSDELQRITLCTASGNCGIGTHPHAFDNR